MARAASRTFASSTENPQQFQLFQPMGGVRAICGPIFSNISRSAFPRAFSAVSSTLKYFRDEYLAHVVDKKCPAGQCKALVTLQIDPELCRGCTKCARLCPVGAISGSVKQPHVIDTHKCIKCRACLDGCSFGAVKEV